MRKRTDYEYDVALSFAGEDRQNAEELAKLLKKGGYEPFYDKYEMATLWGKNLYDHLSSIYKDKAYYCVMFLSEHYAQKLWTNHERQSAQARAFEENREYILPILLDDTEVPGILKTVGYLYLRLISIEKIYQLLVEKLSDSTSYITTPDVATSVKLENDSDEFVLLLCPENRKQYFIPFQDVRWSGTEISLELLPESLEEIAFLRSLRANSNKKLAFAHQEDAAWVHPQNVVQTTSGPQTIWQVPLELEDSRGRGYDSFYNNNISVNGISSEQIAEMRTRRILLNEKHTPNLNVFGGWDSLESYISGGISVQPEVSLQISESPIPNLYRSFGETPEKFKKFAYLASVLYLKLSHTVEHILELDLELRNPKQLWVSFKGSRPQPFSNVEPSIIQVDGICPLSE